MHNSLARTHSRVESFATRVLALQRRLMRKSPLQVILHYRECIALSRQLRDEDSYSPGQVAPFWQPIRFQEALFASRLTPFHEEYYSIIAVSQEREDPLFKLLVSEYPYESLSRGLIDELDLRADETKSLLALHDAREPVIRPRLDLLTAAIAAYTLVATTIPKRCLRLQGSQLYTVTLNG